MHAHSNYLVLFDGNRVLSGIPGISVRAQTVDTRYQALIDFQMSLGTKLMYILLQYHLNSLPW